MRPTRSASSYGATAELNQKNWALRAGYFLMDKESNSNDFDMNVFRRGEYVIELEERYYAVSPSRQAANRSPGSTAIFSGSYRETLDNPALGARHRADPPRPHQIRLRLQRRAVDHRRHRRVRTMELERRPATRSWRSPTSTAACRSAPRSRAAAWGRPERHDRHRRRHQRPVRRSPRLHRGRRPRPPDRRRGAQLPDRADPGDLLLGGAVRRR